MFNKEEEERDQLSFPFERNTLAFLPKSSMKNRFDELSYASLKSIDINSIVDCENSLMNDLRKSYPAEDMRRTLSNLPVDIDLDHLTNCARSAYSSSDQSIE